MSQDLSNEVVFVFLVKNGYFLNAREFKEKSRRPHDASMDVGLSHYSSLRVET